jgi:hypothetical protein
MCAVLAGILAVSLGVVLAVAVLGKWQRGAERSISPWIVQAVAAGMAVAVGMAIWLAIDGC